MWKFAEEWLTGEGIEIPHLFYLDVSELYPIIKKKTGHLINTMFL